MTNREDEKLLGFLTVQNERLNFHGDKMWEEMKHFSWALYIILGAPFALREINDLKEWLIFFPFFAIFVAIIALKIIQKEGKDFLDALGTVLSIEKRLGFHEVENAKDPKMIVSEERMNKLGKNGSIKDFKNKENWKCNTTRWFFKIYFIGLILCGFIEIYYFSKYTNIGFV